jgi:hypothetical protein
MHPELTYPKIGHAGIGRPGAARIGVGLLFNGALIDLLGAEPDAVEVGHTGKVLAGFRPRSRRALVAHGVGLSIASGSTFDIDHVRQLAEWQRRYRFAWISEHLSAVRVQTEVTPDHQAGLALPLAWNHDLLDMLCERVARAHPGQRAVARERRGANARFRLGHERGGLHECAGPADRLRPLARPAQPPRRLSRFARRRLPVRGLGDAGVLGQLQQMRAAIGGRRGVSCRSRNSSVPLPT